MCSSDLPELMQQDMTPVRLAASGRELLAQPERASRMRSDLLRVRAALTRDGDPLRRTADLIAESLPVSGTLAGASATASGSQLVQGIGRQ